MKIRKIQSALMEKGFRLTNKGNRRRHHNKYVYHWINGSGASRFYTYTSLGKKGRSISVVRINQMASQVGLNKDEFVDLIECPMNQNMYEQTLLERYDL